MSVYHQVGCASTTKTEVLVWKTVFHGLEKVHLLAWTGSWQNQKKNQEAEAV